MIQVVAMLAPIALMGRVLTQFPLIKLSYQRFEILSKNWHLDCTPIVKEIWICTCPASVKLILIPENSQGV
jgi:hypothetical protein